MANAANDLSANIREQFLSCKICLDDLKYPKTLPCLHTFCAQCIHYYIDSNNVDGRKFSCPVCRRQIYIPKNGVDGFPDSFFMSSLEDMVTRTTEERSCGICKFRNDTKRSTNLCVECKIQLCQECSDAHCTAKVTEGHTLLPVSAGPGDDDRENYCRVHRGETVKYYCETCNSPVCLPCTFLEHRAHQIEEIKNVRNSFNQDMAGLVMQSKDNIIQLAQSKADLVELENELFIRKEQAKTQVRRAVQELMKCLNEQEAKLMNELDDFYDIVSVSKDRQRLERTIFRLQRAHDFAEQLLSSDTSPIAQIVNKAEAKESLHQALNYDLPDPSLHATKLLQNTVFLPGHHSFKIGTLLKCSEGSGSLVSTLRPALPSTKAVFMHSLKINGDTALGEVLALAFLSTGNPVVLMSTGKRVKVFTKRGNLKLEFGGDDELQHPSDLTVTRDDGIAATDCGLLGVKVFDQFGTLRTEFGSCDVFQLPIALTTDSLGKYIVCDQVKQRLTVHRESGDLLQAVDIPEIAMPQFMCSFENKLYICDGENKEIAIYKLNRDLTGNYEFITKLTTPERDTLTPITEDSSEADYSENRETNANMTTSAFVDEENQVSQETYANTETRSFLDCSAICTDYHGNLVITDARVDRIHSLNEKGEMSSILPRGKQIRRPTCAVIFKDGTLAVAQQGADLLDQDTSSMTHINLYRMIRADV